MAQPISDDLLFGLAMQAQNMVRKDLARECLIAVYHDGEGLKRMTLVEEILLLKLGQDWLDNAGKKDIAFSIIRKAVDTMPPDAILISTNITQYEPTPKFDTLSDDEQQLFIEAWQTEQGVKDGFLDKRRALMVTAQTPQRACLLIQYTVEGGLVGVPLCKFFDQEHFDGRLKMFGDSKLLKRKGPPSEVFNY